MRYQILLLPVLLLLAIGSYGQNNAGWRLAKKTYNHPDGAMIEEYRYDSKGNITGMSYKQGKKLVYTETNFTTNAQNKLTGFTRNYANNLTPRETYTMEYNGSGQLQKLTQTVFKEGKEKFAFSNEYKWDVAIVKVTETRASFAGNLTRITTNSLDNAKNILKKEFTDKDGKETASAFIFTGYDTHINPLLLRGNYTAGDVLSPNNNLDEKTEGNIHGGTLTYLYNKDGLPTESKTIYTFADSGPVTHKVLYQYIKVVNPAGQTSKAAVQIPDIIREKAIAEDISNISVCLYNNDTVYLLTKKSVGQNRSILNIQDQYYAGNGKLVKNNSYTQTFYLPRKDEKIIPLISSIKL